jgi:DNA-binding transcriptional regulator YhcF (GntR family)
MLVRVDPTAREPLYLQIAGQVRAAIGDGSLGAGDRLPTARELASGLDVNMHTVLRAYSELRDEGLVEMRRRRGVIVRDAGPGRAHLLSLARELRTEARRQGMPLADVHEMLKEIW